LPNALDESEIVQFLNVEELVNKYQIPCRIVISLKKNYKSYKKKDWFSNSRKEICQASLGTGNKLDESIKSGFDWLLKYIIFKYDELKTRIDYDVQLQKNRESKIKQEKQEKIKHSREADK
jgi:hypothetical protein